VPGSGRGIAIGEASVTIVSSTLEMNKAIGFGKERLNLYKVIRM
jgi:hypothetical protein